MNSKTIVLSLWLPYREDENMSFPMFQSDYVAIDIIEMFSGKEKRTEIVHKEILGESIAEIRKEFGKNDHVIIECSRIDPNYKDKFTDIQPLKFEYKRPINDFNPNYFLNYWNWKI